jgi:hypothetical protein
MACKTIGWSYIRTPMFFGNEGNVSVAGEPILLLHRSDTRATKSCTWLDRPRALIDDTQRSFSSFGNDRSAIDGKIAIIYRRRQMRTRLMA